MCRKYAIAYQNKDECEFTEAVCACSLIYYAYERYPRLFFIIFTKTTKKTTLIVIVLRKMNLFGFSYWQSNLWNGLENN